jgi:nucleoside-diphosphate-sugar epimerase
MKILITRATGFIGSALIESLANIQGFTVVGMVRLINDF